MNLHETASRLDRKTRRALDKYSVEFIDLMMAISNADHAGNQTFKADPKSRTEGSAWVEMPTSLNRTMIELAGILKIGTPTPNGRKFAIRDSQRMMVWEARINPPLETQIAWVEAFASNMMKFGHTVYAKTDQQR